MKFFPLALIFFSLLLPAQAQQQTQKKTAKSKNPDSRENFYVIKGTNIKHGEYSKTLIGMISVSEKGQYDNGIKTGIWEYFDSQGQVEQRYDFTQGELIYDKHEPSSIGGATKSALIINGELRENNTGQLPVLLGGRSKYAYYLVNNLVYPSEARVNKVEGTVIISVTITMDGKIIDEQVEGEAGFGLGEEALRVVRLLPDEWVPIIVDGEPMATRLFIPIRFKLS